MNFKKPDLTAFAKASPEQMAVAEKYTRIAPCCVEDEPEAHTAWLVVGPQQFRVSAITHETAEEASWMCWMLAKALLAMGVTIDDDG